MSPSNTSFFFVPGGFSPGAYFHKVVDLLEQKGYQAQALDLPSMDTTLKDQGKIPGFYDDADYLRTAVAQSLDSGKDAIIVASSYGSAVTFEACKGLTTKDRVDGGKLKHLIVLGGLLCEAGPTVKELIGMEVPVANESDLDARMPFQDSSSALTPAPTLTHLPPMDPCLGAALLCASLPPDQQTHYLSMAKPICIQAFVQPITFAGWKEVPTTLVIGEKDVILPLEKQEESYRRAVESGVQGLAKVVVEGGDHLVMLSHAERVVGICVGMDGEGQGV
ncbi:alpha/beta-hydrolase [Decorospora gaudefroyi]|uniref:Alpha/beta-hydrolase n=1 Tax=Decorospora gaudefroyi TaxID=184978 RepID=A0A6A5KUC4_9PLEO|nr:alpha/beta-hydrolase [Decorospora gaudefroyi]